MKVRIDFANASFPAFTRTSALAPGRRAGGGDPVHLGKDVISTTASVSLVEWPTLTSICQFFSVFWLFYEITEVLKVRKSPFFEEEEANIILFSDIEKYQKTSQDF